jgi:hypothetical protein
VPRQPSDMVAMVTKSADSQSLLNRHGRHSPWSVWGCAEMNQTEMPSENQDWHDASRLTNGKQEYSNTFHYNHYNLV